jgi:hypothetical protein
MDEVFGAGKALDKILDPIADIIKKVAGPAAEEVGLTVQDSIKVYRAKRQYRLFEKVRKFVDKAGYDPKRIPLKILLPSLDYASVEEDDDLHTMWAALLANTARPNSEDIPTYFPDILRQLSSNDARLLIAFMTAPKPKDEIIYPPGAINRDEPFSIKTEILYMAWRRINTNRKQGNQKSILEPLTDERNDFLDDDEFLISLNNLTRLGLVEYDNEMSSVPLAGVHAGPGSSEHTKQRFITGIGGYETELFTTYFPSPPQIRLIASNLRGVRLSFRITYLGRRFVRMCSAPKRPSDKHKN